jgi:hypothetical protein
MRILPKCFGSSCMPARPIPSFFGVIALSLVLSMLSGCAGGWQGAKSSSSTTVVISSPENQTVTVGQTATFSVSANGGGPFTYQWYKNGSPISGAISNIYTTRPTSMGDTGAVFTVSVSSAAGTVTSSPATLTVNAIKPTITTQPASQTVTLGQPATFGVTANGTGPLAYQWYMNGIAISGATSSTYTTPPTTSSNNGAVYTVTVANSAGSVTSNSASLAIPNSSPIATSLVPSNSTPPYDGTVLLVPTFSGGTAVIGSAGVGSSDITASAMSGASYPTPALTSGKTYTLTVTSPTGTLVSTSCIVTPTSVTISPVTPANQNFPPGPATFMATATGGLTNGLTWTASSGAFAGNVWTAPAVAGIYTITATSVDNPSVSVTTTATIVPPSIIAQPTSQRVCSGGVLTLSVIANFATSYQWSFNGAAILGATNSTYPFLARLRRTTEIIQSQSPML